MRCSALNSGNNPNNTAMREASAAATATSRSQESSRWTPVSSFGTNVEALTKISELAQSPSVPRPAREAPESVARQLSSVVAGLGRGLATRLRRASRMVRAWRKSTSLARLCGRPFSVAAAGSATGIAAKSVHLAGISERLPSGSTTSSNATPRRRTAPSACRTRPSKGCRSRRIVTGRGKSRRWVVCGGVLWEHSPYRTDEIGSAPGRRPACAASDQDVARKIPSRI